MSCHDCFERAEDEEDQVCCRCPTNRLEEGEELMGVALMWIPTMLTTKTVCVGESVDKRKIKISEESCPEDGGCPN